MRDEQQMQSDKGTDRLTAEAEAVFAQELPILEAALKRLLKSLDTQVDPCCSCGLKVARSYNDLRAAETFRGTLNKVQAYSRRLREAGRCNTVDENTPP